MSLLARLLGKTDAKREAVRPLWHRTVEIARSPDWYARCGVADTVPGRFDAITLVLSLVLLRMERAPELIEPSVRLTEIFVEDMDGQLRESGVGDLVVGKRMGKLMGVLGGRLGALRDAIRADGPALGPVLERNVSLIDGADRAALEEKVRSLAATLDGASDAQVLAGDFAP